MREEVCINMKASQRKVETTKEDRTGRLTSSDPSDTDVHQLNKILDLSLNKCIHCITE